MSCVISRTVWTSGTFRAAVPDLQLDPCSGTTSELPRHTTGILGPDLLAEVVSAIRLRREAVQRFSDVL